MSRVVNVVSGLYDAIFRPAELVQVHTSHRQLELLEKLRQLQSLAAVYLINLVLYAGPLTLAGFGRQTVPQMPVWFGTVIAGPNKQVIWSILYAFVQNSVFLLTATVLTLVTAHIGVMLTLQSKGLLQTSYAVVYSTSVYLAGMFSVVWYLSTNAGVAAARQLVIDIQKKFIYVVIDYFGADLGLPGGRPGALEFTRLSFEGELLITILIILALYYFYSLYLGVRINHRTDRLYGLLVVAMVAASPAIYVVTTIIAYTNPLIPTP